MTAKAKIKKRQYSRRGCRECKRRKIKCDEATPACRNCSRLSKACVYEAFTFKGTTPKEWAGPLRKYGSLSLQFYEPKKKAKPKHKPADDMQLLFGDACHLVHDISHLLGPFDVEPNFWDTLTPQAHSEEPTLSMAELVERCIDNHRLQEPHQAYLKTLALTDLLYHLYPYALLVESNEVMSVLLSYLLNCTYLLTALLANSATFQYNQAGRARDKTHRDHYISLCFSLLAEGFRGFENPSVFCGNIETLLLTVLVLTAYFTATPQKHDSVLSSWRAHLRGARDLLINYSKILESAEHTPNSDGLALAKCMFFAMELVASIHQPDGGELGRKFDYADLLVHFPDPTADPYSAMFCATAYFDAAGAPQYRETLLKLRLVCPGYNSSDFNRFCGYTALGVGVILRYTAVCDALRHRGLDRAPFFWTNHVLLLVAQAQQEQITPCDPRTFAVDAKALADFQGTAACFAGTGVKYSHYDMAHQYFMTFITFQLLVLPKFMGLPRSHPHVQELVRFVLLSCFLIRTKEGPVELPLAELPHFYLDSLFDMRSIMYQSAFRLCAGCIVSDVDFEKVQLYFTGLMKLGNGLAHSALSGIEKIKEERKKRTPEENEEVLFLDNMSGDIPFC